jgi:hypothetical protein
VISRDFVLTTDLAVAEVAPAMRERGKTALMRSVQFQPIRVAEREGAEAAQIVVVDGCLAAVLVQVVDPALADDAQGWCLQIGFGPCDGEGVLFCDLAAAEAWVRGRFAAGWAATPRHALA